MIVCIDTNVLLQLFGRNSVGRSIRDALFQGHLELAISNEILLEYNEMVTRLSGLARWTQIEKFLQLSYQLHGNIHFIEPQFRFNVIVTDPDDNKFVDCAVAAQADYIITSDRDFNALISAGYKPQPITAEEFIKRFL